MNYHDKLNQKSWITSNFILKGHSQLAHMGIRYHFITNLHIAETRSIQFLTKYDELKIIS